jgi:4-amino-4-deoxy-L-arabinose transferase-like glycosyltransferase
MTSDRHDMRSSLDRLIARPDRAVLVLCAAQILFWTLAPILSHRAPPLDMVEMYAYGHEGVVATYKNPNLPGLILDATRRLTGGAIWPAYVIAQLFVATAFVCVYALGRDLLGNARALAGTLLLTGIYFYSWRTPQLNNNLTQVPLWAGVCLALWRATTSGRLRWWLALGVVSGLVLWAEYSAVSVLVAALVWMVADREARRSFRTAGPWVALAVFAVVVAPQIHFLIESDFLPLQYLDQLTHDDDAEGPIVFVGAQLGMHVVMFIMAGVAGLYGAGAGRRDPGEARAREFLTIMGLGPVAVVVGVALATGQHLKDLSGMPMFNLSGLLLLAWFPGRFDAVSLRRLARFAAVLLVVVPLGYVALQWTEPWTTGDAHRVHWPHRAIAEELTGIYERETGRPPRIVAGPVWDAGVVALGSRADLSVFIDADPSKSPWIAPEDVARHGVLVVWTAWEKPPERVLRFIGDAPIRSLDFSWSSNEDAPPIRLAYVIIPPYPPAIGFGPDDSSARSANGREH